MNRTQRVVFSIMLIIVSCVLISLIQSRSAISGAEAVFLSTQNSNEAYIQSQNTPDRAVFAVIAVTVILLAALWFQNVRKTLFSIAVLSVIPLASACGSVQVQGQAWLFTSRENEVTFVVPLHGDTTSNQAVIGIPAVSSEEFWLGKLEDTREFTVQQYCFQPASLSSCQYRDVSMVITVDTTSVNVEWVAPAVIPGQPMPDMNSAFSMQSLEPNGGSTGVYVGAQLIAHIAPEDAALYLASYGYSERDPNRLMYPARPLASVLNTEVRAFIQTELNREYGQRSVIEQNRDMAVMFDIVREELTEIFGAKGITIDSFGYRDGNVYENPAIQAGIDSAFERQRQLEEAQADATRQSVVNQQHLDMSYSQATQTMVAAQSAAESQALQAEALNANPNLIQLEIARRWDGQLPQIMGESNAVPMVPFPLGNPTATPTPQP